MSLLDWQATSVTPISRAQRGLSDKYVMLLPIAVLRLVSRKVNRVKAYPEGCMYACSVGRGRN